MSDKPQEVEVPPEPKKKARRATKETSAEAENKDVEAGNEDAEGAKNEEKKYGSKVHVQFRLQAENYDFLEEMKADTAVYLWRCSDGWLVQYTPAEELVFNPFYAVEVEKDDKGDIRAIKTDGSVVKARVKPLTIGELCTKEQTMRMFAPKKAHAPKCPEKGIIEEQAEMITELVWRLFR